MANNSLNNNNWLGFSLSPQEELISGDSTCFDHLTPPSPSAHFSLLQPAGNNVTHSNPHPDWKMINPAEDSSAPPKLENFLGHNSFNSDDTTNGGGGGNMGLSMIKHWLRNNPTPKAQPLSLSMSRTSTELGKPKKSVETFGQRTSIYRGVTRHRWTGRYEAHLWDNTCRREGQTRKGRQVYLGGYDKEDKAARSYDLAALKYWGTTTTTNFPMSNYEKEIDDMKHMTRQEYVASLRRKSSGFSRGASIYRGVTRHHQHGRWQARIGRVAGNKDLYLGTFTTQEEAAEAYDIAAIKFRGLSAVTNFEINRYDVKSILDSTALPIGGAAKRLKDAENDQIALQMQRANEANTFLNLQLLTDHPHINHHDDTWQSTIAFQQQPQQLTSVDNYPFALQKPIWCKQEQDTSPEVGYNFLQPSNNNDSFGIPTVDLIHQENNVVGYNYDDEGVFGSADGMRNLYYHQFQQQSMMNDMMSWNHIPTAVPTVALERTDGLNPTFAGWNDS